MTWTAPINGLSAPVEAPYGQLCRGRTSPPDQQHQPINRSKPSQSNLEYNRNLEYDFNLEKDHNPQIPIGSLAEPINLRNAF